ncbi:MAG: hypothetical protein WAV56_01900 [Microgenomates group bacterium]
MATLTETAVVTRKAIKYGAIAFVAITVLWFLGGAAIGYYRALNPAAPPPPTMDFGLLPAIAFPRESGRPTLTLELPTGAIPGFPDRMKVFYAPTKRSGFLDADRAIETARALGFLFKPDQPTETNYIWTNQDQLSSRLNMDIVSGHFKLTRVWQANPALLALASFGSDQQVITDINNYLRKGGLLPDDIDKEQKVTYQKATGGQLTPTISLSEADFVQVDFFRNNYEEIEAETKKLLASYPFYRPDPDYGLVRAVVSGSRDQADKIIGLEYNYTTVDYAKMGTYPIKTGEVAWQEFSNGGGLVTDKSPKTGSIAIRRILLGYYDSPSQSYAMPIYIFLGDRGFVGYVSAVTDSVIRK